MKTHSKENVTYKFSREARKWEFVVGDFQYFTPVKKGVEDAHKVAGFVSGSFKRATAKGQPFKQLDGMARANINQLVG